MKDYKGYLIDLDGTMYNGTEKIEEACEFVRTLKARGIPYLFVTNNSSRTPKQVADKLMSFDIPASEEQSSRRAWRLRSISPSRKKMHRYM